MRLGPSSMKLEINIVNRTVDVVLKKGGREINNLKFIERNNLSEKILANIDKLLRKNKLEPKDIKRVTVKTDEPTSYTTSRIVRSVAKAYNFAVKSEK